MSYPTDATKIGPGIWFALSEGAATADILDSQAQKQVRYEELKAILSKLLKTFLREIETSANITFDSGMIDEFVSDFLNEQLPAIQDGLSPPASDYFIAFFKKVVRNFPCLVCRGHATERVKKKDPAKYKGKVNSKGKVIGMSSYIHEFHNEVNGRLGKSKMEWTVYENIFFNDEVETCDKRCGV